MTDNNAPKTRTFMLSKKMFTMGGGALAVGFIGIQFLPIEDIEKNPEDRNPLGAPPEIESILRRACYDCHSNETQWPWYSRVAPMSWLVAKDVAEGRSILNLSELDEGDIEDEKETMWEEIEGGNMPLWFYVPLHPEAKLSAQDLSALKEWATAKPAEQGSEKPAPDDDAKGEDPSDD